MSANTSWPFLQLSSCHKRVTENNGHLAPFQKVYSGTEIIIHGSEFPIFNKNIEENDRGKQRGNYLSFKTGPKGKKQNW